MFALSAALLDFTSMADLVAWLNPQAPSYDSHVRVRYTASLLIR
jgi:hypothetical protein